MDDLDDIGFDEQVLNGILRTAHLELCGFRFIARCDQAMLTTEQRIPAYSGALKVPNSTVQIGASDLRTMSANLAPGNSQCIPNAIAEKGRPCTASTVVTIEIS